MKSPHWRSRRQLFQQRPAGSLQDWLFEPGSLTHRLRQFCRQGFTLRLQSLRRARPRPDEAAALHLRHGQRALVREVRLLCGEQAAVYARSIIPLPTLRGGTARLAALGQRPLADILFTNQAIQRGTLEFARLIPENHLYHPAGAAFQTSEPLWARRAVFRVAEKKLLVSEVFAPWLAVEDS